MLIYIFRDPLWLLVNVIIVGDKLEKVTFMFDDMMDQLERYLTVYCVTQDLSPNLVVKREPSCGMKEYTQTKKYVAKIDELLQNHLFKISPDSDQLVVILGFFKIQEMFDERVKLLFEEKLVCPEEVNTIKNEYM